MVDRFTRWIEVMPLSEITAEEVANAFYSGWISRFGTPSRVTTDQGRQFESALFSKFTALTGTKRIRTTPYHPQANGLIERQHRTLKAAIKCRSHENWLEAIPSVLLGMRASYKEGIAASSAELVYGTTLRLPGQFWPATNSTEGTTVDYVEKLKSIMNSIKPVPTENRSVRTVFVHPRLESCSHIFLRQDMVCSPLTPPYSGPFEVLKRGPKTFTINVKGNNKCVSVNRLKPAFTEKDEDMLSQPKLILPSPQSQPLPQAELPAAPITTTRSGRICRPPVRFA